VPAAAAAYLGDGGSDELAGARIAGFGMVVLAEEAQPSWCLTIFPGFVHKLTHR
jgi:hypothetical protein